MIAMFYGCLEFNQELNNWDVSNVTIMKCMFRCCYEFNQPFNDWNVSNVRNMKKMFVEQGNNFNKPHWYNK